MFLYVVVYSLLAGLNGVSGVNSARPACNGRIGCPRTISVAWYERKPYVYQVNNRTQGILPDVVGLLLNECCGNASLSCWQLDHDTKPVKDVTNLLFSSLSAVILYPVIVDVQDPKDNTISLVPPTGIAFLVPRSEPQSFPRKLLVSVFDAWPVLILTFLLSILAGIVLWVTEIRVNPEEFPRTFIRGSWEGFWWAFVSMTTVGYGDRSPRSFFGRLFAVCWILIGICIVSIFTATLTTSLTTITMDTNKVITGSKIGVLERSIELSTAMQQQSDIKVYSTIRDIRKALDEKEIEGTLLDKYVISHYKDLFPDEFFKVDQVVSQDKISYGAVVNDSQLNECFQQVLRHDIFIVYNFIRKELQRTMSTGDNQAVKNSQSIFDPTGDLFYPSLYSCIGLVIAIIVIGIVVELVYLRPSHCIAQRSQKYAVNEIEMSNLGVKELEKEMIQEINEIVKKYHDKMKQVEERYNRKS